MVDEVNRANTSVSDYEPPTTAAAANVPHGQFNPLIVIAQLFLDFDTCD